MVTKVSQLHLVGQQPQPALWRDDELLDESVFLGMGRSLTFPFPQYRARDRFRTVYFDTGPTARRRGKTVVFLHGLGANATHWEPVARAMVGRHRLVGLDLVGLGWSAKPRIDYSIDLLRDHLLGFLDRQQIGRAHLVGHSMGGAVALAAALARPAQFDSVTLVCAAGAAPLPAWMRIAAPIFLREWLLFHSLSVGFDFILNNVFVDNEADNEHVAWFRRSALRDDPGYPNLRDFARVCETLCPDIARRDYSEQFHRMPQPVLGIWGDHDKLTTLSNVLRSLGKLRRVRTVIVPRCGHMPMVERPEETIFHLERFLQSPP
jgi:pimeloyl-ACP methyl ester carboxylesterase